MLSHFRFDCGSVYHFLQTLHRQGQISLLTSGFLTRDYELPALVYSTTFIRNQPVRNLVRQVHAQSVELLCFRHRIMVVLLGCIQDLLW